MHTAGPLGGCSLLLPIDVLSSQEYSHLTTPSLLHPGILSIPVDSAGNLAECFLQAGFWRHQRKQ